MSRTETHRTDTLVSRIQTAFENKERLIIADLEIKSFYPEISRPVSFQNVRLDANTVKTLREKKYPLRQAIVEGEFTETELTTLFGSDVENFPKKEELWITGQITGATLIARIKQGFTRFKNIRVTGVVDFTTIDCSLVFDTADFTQAKFDNNNMICIYDLLSSYNTKHVSFSVSQLKPLIHAYYQKKFYVKKQVYLPNGGNKKDIQSFDLNCRLYGFSKIHVVGGLLPEPDFQLMRENGAKYFDQITLVSNRPVSRIHENERYLSLRTNVGDQVLPSEAKEKKTPGLQVSEKTLTPDEVTVLMNEMGVRKFERVKIVDEAPDNQNRDEATAGFSAAKFEIALKSGKRNFNDKKIINDEVDLSVAKERKIEGLELNYQFNGPVNFCNCVLKNSDLSQAKFMSGIIINRKTDFLFCNLFNCDNSMLITFQIDAQNSVSKTAEEWCDWIEDQYTEARRGKLEKIRTNKIKAITKEFPNDENKGRRFFAYLNHIQTQEREWFHGPREFLGITSRRMHEVFHQKILVALMEQKNARKNVQENREVIQLTRADVIEKTFLERRPKPVEVSGPSPTFLILERARTALSEFLDVNEAPSYHRIVACRARFETTIKAFQATSGSDAALSPWIACATERLDKALSSFFSSDILNNDLHTETERLLHENQIVAAFIFLKIIGNDAVIEKYKKKLQDDIYPHYLRYVVHQENFYDDRGIQKKLRYNLLEKLFIEAEMMPQSVNALSEKRGEKTGGSTAFFSYQFRHDSPFKHYCAAEWARMSLSVLVKANCVDTEIATHVQKEMKNYKGFSDPIMHEKKLYIAELIKREDYAAAEIEYAAFKDAWPESDALEMAFTSLKEVTISDVEKSGKLDGRYKQFLRYIDFVERLTKKYPDHSVVFGMNCSSAHSLKNVLAGSVLVTRTIQSLAHYVLAVPPTRVPEMILQQLINLANASYNQSRLTWAGDARSLMQLQQSLLQVESPLYQPICHAIDTFLSKIKPIHCLLPYYAPLPEKIELSDVTPVLVAVYQTEYAIKKIRIALAPVFTFPALAGVTVNGVFDETIPDKLEKRKIALGITEKDDFKAIQENVAIQQFLTTCGIQNPVQNYKKYFYMLSLMQTLKTQKAYLSLLEEKIKRDIKNDRSGEKSNLSVIAQTFDHVATVLDTIAQAVGSENAGFFSELYYGNFVRSLEDAKVQVSEAKAAWEEQVNAVYTTEWEVRTRDENSALANEIATIKEDIKIALTNLLTPLFEYIIQKIRDAEKQQEMHYPTLLEEDALMPCGFKLQGHQLRADPNSPCQTFLEHVLAENAIKYVQVFRLQEAKRSCVVKMDSSASREAISFHLNDMEHVLELVKQKIIDEGQSSTYLKTRVFYELINTALIKIRAIKMAVENHLSIPDTDPVQSSVVATRKLLM